MGTIRFALKKEVKDKEGLSPIQLVYQMHGQKRRPSTGLKTYAENWDLKNQIVGYVKKGQLSNEDVKALNNKLIDLRRQIEKIEERFENRFIDEKKKYTIDDIIEVFNKRNEPGSKKESTSNEVFAFIDEYIRTHEYLRVPGSLSVYRSLSSHLKEFESRNKKVTFENIDYSFFQSFQNYLVSKTKKTKEGKITKALNNITIAKQLSTLKTLLNYAKAQGIEVSRKYDSFKIKRETDLEVIALTRHEFDLLYEMDLSKKQSWAQVRDVFCFSCTTGLRYSDLKQLRKEHIKGDHLDLTAVKTSHKTIIPLNPYSRAILKKYERNEKPLPVISNKGSNEHLNTICEWAGITQPVEIVRRHGKDRVVNVYPKHELIRMHCGRKTFATLSIENGMPAEQVMKIGGWKDYKSFKRYLNITDDSSKAAMQQAWGNINKPSKLKAV